MEKNKIFNIVYDNWNEITNEPKPNYHCAPNDRLIYSIDSIGILQHWISESKIENKFTIKQCKMSEVGENPNQNYFYMIGHYTFQLRQLFWTYLDPWKNNPTPTSPFNEIVTEYLKKYKNFKLLLHTEHECDSEDGFVGLIKFLKSNDIDESQVIVTNNNAKIYEYKIKYNSKITVHPMGFLPSSYSGILSNHLGGCDFIIDKPKFFLCLNRGPKIHRILLLSMLKRNNILVDTNWSWVPIGKPSLEEEHFKRLLKDDYEKIKEDVDYILNLKIKKSDYEVDKGWFNVYDDVNTDGLPMWMRMPELLQTYENSYVNLTTESEFENRTNTIHITEKSFKPFYQFQFPMILASKDHLKTLRERYDFDFFDDMINHDYDYIEDEKERFFRYFNEVLKIYRNKNKFIEFYKNNRTRFEKNRYKVIKILESESDYNFFESLI
jgi:hypothetical protein